MTRHPDRQAEGRIDLRIDRVVLDGFALEPRDQDRFRAGLESELARLLTEHGLPDGPAGATSRNDHEAPRPADRVDLRGGTVADGAARVARQVYESIHRAVRS